MKMQGPSFGGSNSPPPGQTIPPKSNPQIDYEAHQKSQQEAQNKANKEYKRQQEQIAKNKKKAAALFSEGTLGRVDPSRLGETQGLIDSRQREYELAQQRSGDTQDVMARRQAALAGLSAPEQQAQREALQGNIMGQAQGQMRALRGAQAASGIRGPAAGAQNQAIAAQAVQQQAMAERDLALAQEAAKREALGAYEGTVRGVEGEEFDRRTTSLGGLEGTTTDAQSREMEKQLFNLQQQQQEKFGQMAAQLSYDQLAAQNYANQQQSNAVAQSTKRIPIYDIFGGITGYQ